jgi:TM2 domain-containing membrane protein YozV
MILDKNTPAPSGRRRSPSLAALLSFLWPGLGQFYLGKRRLAALFAVPALLILLILAYQLRQGVVVFAARFADPTFSLAAIVVVVAAGVWRLTSVVHAFRAGEHLKTRRVIDRAVVVALAAVIVISHLGVSGLLLVTYNADRELGSRRNARPNIRLAADTGARRARHDTAYCGEHPGRSL